MSEESPQVESLMLFQQKLGYHFINVDLLATALTHTSYLNESQSVESDNERLEFLGDAVLGLAVSSRLIELYPNLPEGKLTKFKSRTVNERTLATVAKRLDLGDFIRLGRGEEQTGGRSKSSILSNTVEAVIGAIFLDRGFAAAKRVIEQHFNELIQNVRNSPRSLDFKSALQERVQAVHKNVPRYKTLSQLGPDHDKRFEVGVLVEGDVVAVGYGRSKKEAEKQAAEKALQLFQNRDQPQLGTADKHASDS